MVASFAIVPLNGVLDSAFATMADVFHTACALEARAARTTMVGNGYETLTVTGKSVRSARGTLISGDRHLSDGKHPPVVVIPGIDVLLDISVNEAMDALLARRDAQRLVAWLAAMPRAPVVVAAGCTATFLLAEAGLLDGREATTTWWLGPLFRERYPEVVLQERRTVTCADGVACAGAAMAHVNLALFLVSRFRSPALAEQVARQLLLDSGGRQACHIDYSSMNDLPPVIRRAEEWVKNHLAEPITITEIAHAIAVSPRTLARRLMDTVGRSPIKFVQHLRVREAIHLLQNTMLSLEEIALRVGYSNAVSLRRVIIRDTGRRPNQFRRVGE